MKLRRVFNGKMDVDSGDRFVQAGDYRLLENGIIDQDGGSNRFSVKNLKSTKEEVDLGLTGYTCIGAEIYKRVIYAFYNNDTLTKLYKIPIDDFANPVELFSKDIDQDTSYHIKDIDFVEDLENSYIFCYFNDTVNQPFKVNLTRLEASSTYYSAKSDMYVIKAPHQSAPIVHPTEYLDAEELEYTNTGTFSFGIRYVYEDGEKTSISALSAPLFVPSSVNNNANQLINTASGAVIEYNSGSKHVSKAEIICRDNETLAYYLCESIDVSASIDTTLQYTYRKDVFTLIAESVSNMIYSNVPISARAQRYVAKRLIYGDYTDGYSIDHEPTFSLVDYYDKYAVAIETDTDATDYINTYDLSSYNLKKGDKISSNLDIEHRTTGDVIKIRLDYVLTEDYADASSLEDVVFLSASGYITIASTSTAITFTIDDDTHYQFHVSTGLRYEENVLGTSLKSNESYKYTIQYYDDYDRRFPLPQPQKINISPVWARTASTEMSAYVKLTIDKDSVPPTGATKYRVLRQNKNHNYLLVSSIGATAVGSDTYIQISKQYESLLTDDLTTVEVVYGNGAFPDAMIYANIKDIVVTTATKPSGFGSNTISIIVANSDITATGFSSAGSSWDDAILRLHRRTQVDDELYYEIPQTFYINGANHLGNEQDQVSGTTDCILDLSFDGDVVIKSASEFTIDYDESVRTDFTYYAEKYAIKDGGSYLSVGRGVVFSENFNQVRRYASVCWSELYVDDIEYNGLSSFNLSMANYADFKKEYGAITGLHEHLGRLLILQEDKIGVAELNRAITTTAEGAQQINLTDNFLLAEAYNPYAGDYGSISDWSFAKFGNAKYFIDKRRKVVVRLSADGLTDISRYFMESHFKDINDDEEAYDYIGVYNANNSEYWLYNTSDETIYIYDEKVNGWTRYLTGITVDLMKDYHGGIYAFDGDKIYSVGTGLDYGNIFGEQKQFKLGYVENQESAYPKVHTAIEVESNKAIDVSLSSGDLEANIDNTDFETRENEYFAYIPNAGTPTLSDNDLETLMIKPLGEVVSNTTAALTMKSTLPNNLRTISEHTTGDYVYAYNSTTDTYAKIGEISSISGLNITMSFDTTPSVNLYADKFVFAVENSYINARNMRGNVVNVEITDNGSEALIIESVIINAIQSKND